MNRKKEVLEKLQFDMGAHTAEECMKFAVKGKYLNQLMNHPNSLVRMSVVIRADEDQLRILAMDDDKDVRVAAYCELVDKRNNK